MSKKVHIKTWGCQMNVYDSDRMVDVVAPLGYIPTDEAADADLVIFNTCHIREKASEKLFSELGRLREQREMKAQQGGRMMVAVAGCVAQAEGAEIKKRVPWIDMIFGPQTYHQLPEMIARVSREKGVVLNTEFPTEPKFDFLPDVGSATKVSAFLAIQEGCDKFCTFCVVPYTRGAEYSRSVDAIVAEAERLVREGAREITLLGQNVNAFHGDGPDGKTWGLGRLFYRLAEIPELKRLRYTTSHPRDMDEELMLAHRDIPQLMPFLHLPVQSGSDVILEAMNRKHTGDDYHRVIDRLRSLRPDVALSSDFIIGFPGETDKDFDATIKLVRDIGFAQSFSFKYSRRPGTPASAMNNQVEENVMDVRLQELQKLLREQQTQFNAKTVGQTLSVLAENKMQKDGKLFGRTPYMQAMHIAAPEDTVGQEIHIRVTGSSFNRLDGTVKTISANAA